MKLYCIYFSPTGGTKKVIKNIATAWDCEKVYIDITQKDVLLTNITLESQDVCLVAVPSFGGRVPQVAALKLQQLKGNNTKAILITSYGNRDFEDTLLELKDIMDSVGFINVAAISAVAEHSIMRNYGTGRPNTEDIAQLKAFALKCKELAGTKEQSATVPGNKPYREYGGVPLKPKASGACTSCGICAKACPVSAIPEQSPKETNDELCISCMRCIAVCPAEARKINGVMLKIASMKMKKAFAETKKNEMFV